MNDINKLLTSQNITEMETNDEHDNKTIIWVNENKRDTIKDKTLFKHISKIIDNFMGGH